jgi:hypothetical protein
MIPATKGRTHDGAAHDFPKSAEHTTLLRLDGPDRKMVAALLAFVTCGLACGSTLEQMEGRPSGIDERCSLALQGAIAQIPPHLIWTAVRCLKELTDADR